MCGYLTRYFIDLSNTEGVIMIEEIGQFCKFILSYRPHRRHRRIEITEKAEADT